MIRDTRNKLVEHRVRIEDLRAAILTPQRERRVRDVLGTDPWRLLRIDQLRVGAAQGSIGLVIEASIAPSGNGED